MGQHKRKIVFQKIQHQVFRKLFIYFLFEVWKVAFYTSNDAKVSEA